MALIQRGTYPAEIKPGLDTVVWSAYGNNEKWWTAIYEKKKANLAVMRDRLVAGLQPATYKPEGDTVQYLAGGESFEAQYVITTKAIGFVLTEEVMEDYLYGDIASKYSKAAARSYVYTQNVAGADILNNGFNTNPQVSDGVAIFSTSHPTFSGATQSNKLATPADISETSVEALVTQIRKAKDEQNMFQQLRPAKLVVPEELRFESNRILYTPGRTQTGDNDINALNYLNDIKGLVSTEYLTDADAWFITTNAEDGLKYFEKRAMTTAMMEDFDTGNMRYKVTGRWVHGITDWRGVFGSEGAAN